MSFKYSAFISYAWGDNTDQVSTHPGSEGKSKGWVASFHEMLSECLANDLGKTEVFRDATGMLNDSPLDDQIDGLLAESATLVIVASENYLLSPWCCDELRMFQEHCRRRGQEGGVFVCELKPLAEERLPTALRRLLRFKMFKHQGAATPRLQFAFEDDRRLIFDACVNLSNQIAELVRRSEAARIQVPENQKNEMEGRFEREERLIATPVENSKKVFLADVTDDLAFERGELRAHLKRLGYCVLPDGDEFFDSTSEECIAMLEKHLGESDAFIQLLSGISGRVLNRVGTTYPEFQFSKASDLGVPVYQWRSKNIQFGDALRNAVTETYKDILFGRDVVAMNFEAYKSHLEKSLVLIRANSNESEQPGVLVRYDDAQRREVAELQETLNRRGMKTGAVSFQRKNRKHHARYAWNVDLLQR